MRYDHPRLTLSDTLSFERHVIWNDTQNHYHTQKSSRSSARRVGSKVMEFDPGRLIKRDYILSRYIGAQIPIRLFDHRGVIAHAPFLHTAIRVQRHKYLRLKIDEIKFFLAN